MLEKHTKGVKIIQKKQNVFAYAGLFNLGY